MEYNLNPIDRYYELKNQLESIGKEYNPMIGIDDDIVDKIEKDMQECIEDIKFEDVPREWIIYEGKEKIQEYSEMDLRSSIHYCKKEIADVSYQEWIESGFGKVKNNGDIILKHNLVCLLTGENIVINTIVRKA